MTMIQTKLIEDDNEDQNKFYLGNDLVITIRRELIPIEYHLYKNDLCIKILKGYDKAEKKLFIIDAVQAGAKKNHLAKAFGIARQTIDNYLNLKDIFGVEGVIRGYNIKDGVEISEQRKKHQNKEIKGNKAELAAKVKRKEKEELKKEEDLIQLSFEFDTGEKKVGIEQIFEENHDWEASRYAGIFLFLPTLLVRWKWLELIQGYYGNAFKILMVFLLMAVKNIRSIEQLKNVKSREAGIVLGLGKLPSKPIIWKWFYMASEKKISAYLHKDYFKYQIRTGLVSLWFWLTDGHLLPYTGKEKTHYSYNTQRRMPFKGQTNQVTCDETGRIVCFEIEEGKGDMISRIIKLNNEWRKDAVSLPMSVFDREIYGAKSFSRLIKNKIDFVTWDKNVDKTKLSAIDENLFTINVEKNGKQYSIFEESKKFTYTPEKSDEKLHTFELRRIIIWNKKTNRRTAGLAWTENQGRTIEECLDGILTRWGASENTFKHLKERHPLHYCPGFKLSESEKQDIANPEIKRLESKLGVIKKELSKLYKSYAKESINKNGETPKNSRVDNFCIKIKELEEKEKTLKDKKKLLPKRIDVSSLEDYDSFKKIDTEGKNLFDFVTASVWNARKQLIDWLLPYFGLKNEVVDLFYAITESHGWMKVTESAVIVRLEPIEQKKRRAAQIQLCRKVSNLDARIMNGKRLFIEVGESPF